MKIIKGNLLDLAEAGEFNIIVHGCNCFHTMGGGIAKEIKQRYPYAYYADLTTKRGDRSKLGTYSVMLGKRFNIINAYTQYSLARPGECVFEYDAFEQILGKLFEEYPQCQFGFPKIGCGLAGGDEGKILSMINTFDLHLASQGVGSATVVDFTK